MNARAFTAIECGEESKGMASVKMLLNQIGCKQKTREHRYVLYNITIFSFRFIIA